MPLLGWYVLYTLCLFCAFVYLFVCLSVCVYLAVGIFRTISVVECMFFSMQTLSDGSEQYSIRWESEELAYLGEYMYQKLSASALGMKQTRHVSL